MKRSLARAAAISATVVGLASAWPASAGSAPTVHGSHPGQVASERTERLRVRATESVQRRCAQVDSAVMGDRCGPDAWKRARLG